MKKKITKKNQNQVMINDNEHERVTERREKRKNKAQV